MIWSVQTGLHGKILALVGLLWQTLLLCIGLLGRALFQQIGLAEQILLARKGLLEQKLTALTELLEWTILTLTVLLGCISLILRVFLQHAIAWKVSKYGDFLVCIFPHSDWIRRGVFLPIHSECGKIQTKKNSVFGHFWCSERYYYIWICSTNIKNTNRFTWTNITTPGSLTRINRTSTNGFNWMAITTTDRFT